MGLWTPFIIDEKPYEDDEQEAASELDGFEIFDEEDVDLDWGTERDLEAIDRERDI